MSLLPKGKYSSQQDTIEVTKVHGDLSQEVVRITVDRLRLILHKHATSIEERKGWIAPLGIFISLTITLVTADFKSVVWPPNVWCAVFIIADALTFLWLLKAAKNAWFSTSIEALVDKIKDHSSSR